MIRVAITAEAFEAIKATLSFGSVAYFPIAATGESAGNADVGGGGGVEPQ
jgi:hypothetical protein